MMAYRIMCKRSKCDNIIFGDGVMQEIIDLINSNSKDLSFERQDTVTSHRHLLLINLLAKMCEEKLNNNLTCGIHYRIYDRTGKELMHAMISYFEGEFGHTTFEVYYHNMPALEYTMNWYTNKDEELVSNTLAFFTLLHKKSYKFKNYTTVFDFDGYFNTPREFRNRLTVYPLPIARGRNVWARAGERRALRQVKRLQNKQR